MDRRCAKVRLLEELGSSDKKDLFAYFFKHLKLPLILFERKSGAILAINDEAEKLYGYSRSAFLDLTIFDLLAEQIIQDRLNRLLFESTFVALQKKSNRSVFPAEIKTQKLPLIGGVDAALCIVRDITREQRCRSIFESIKDAIFLLECGKVADCNQAAENLFAAPRNELIGKSPAELSPAEQKPGIASEALAEEKMQVAAAGNAASFEWRHRKSDGTVFYAEVSLTRMDFPGKLLLLGTVRDINGRRKTSPGNHGEALRTLAGGIAHDFNNLMMPVTGYAELLYETHENDPVTSEALKEIISAANRASKLIQQFLSSDRKKE